MSDTQWNWAKSALKGEHSEEEYQSWKEGFTKDEQQQNALGYLGQYLNPKTGGYEGVTGVGSSDFPISAAGLPEALQHNVAPEATAPVGGHEEEPEEEPGYGEEDEDIGTPSTSSFDVANFKPTKKEYTDLTDPELGQSMAHWGWSLPQEQRNAVLTWGAWGYKGMRAAQQGKTMTFEGDPVGSREKTSMGNFVKAMAKAPVLNVPVYRGMHKLSEATIAKYTPGKIVKLDAHSSGSVNERSAETFAHMAGSVDNQNQKLLLKIIGRAYALDPLGGGLGVEGEYEVIMPKGTKMKITSFSPNKYGNNIHYAEATIVK
jgi:hypothetical protein